MSDFIYFINKILRSDRMKKINTFYCKTKPIHQRVFGTQDVKQIGPTDRHIFCIKIKTATTWHSDVMRVQGYCLNPSSLDSRPEIKHQHHLVLKEPIPQYYNRDKILCPHCRQLVWEAETLLVKDGVDITELKNTFGDQWKTCVVESIDIINANPSIKYLVWEAEDTLRTDKAICPLCNGDLTKEVLNVFSGVRLTVPSAHPLLESTTIVENGNKIAIEQHMTGYGISRDKRAFSQRWSLIAIMDTETGCSYYVPSTKNKAPKGLYPNHVINLTLGSGTIDSYNIGADNKVNRYLFNIIAKKKNAPQYLIDDWNNKISLYDSGGYSTLVFRAICIFNRIPVLSFEQAKSVANDNFGIPTGKIFGGISLDASPKDVILKILKNCKMAPTKSAKKLLANNFDNAYIMYYFHALGFRDINLLPRFIEIFKNRCYQFNRKNISKLTKYLINVKGEVSALSAIKENIFVIEDTSMFFNIIKSKNPKLLKNELFHGNIDEIHDALSDVVSKLDSANEIISYMDEDKKFDLDIDGFSFRRAVDTYELIDVGKKMHICVGSYKHLVLERKCLIIIARDKDSKPVMCIELTPNGGKKYTLKQAKDYCNQHIQSKKAYALKKWIEQTGVDTENCCDYRHIANNNINEDTPAEPIWNNNINEDIAPVEPIWNHNPLLDDIAIFGEEALLPF